MALLQELSESLSTTNDLEKISELFLHKLSELLDNETGALFLADKENNILYPVSTFNWERGALLSKELQFFPEMKQFISNNQFPIHMEKAKKDRLWASIFPGDYEKDISGSFELMQPIIEEKGKLMGIIFLGKKKMKGFYQAQDYNFISISAGMITISLEKARAYRLAMIDGLTNLFVVRYFRERLSEELKSYKSKWQGLYTLND